MRPIERILLVEDHEALLAALRRGIRGWGKEVLCARSVAESKVALQKGVDAVFLDVKLPDGRAGDVVEFAVALRPAPLVIVLSGEATPGEAFELAQQGVAAYLQKPLSLHELRDALDTARRHVPPISALATSFVGKANVRDVADEVRNSMEDQAVALCRGNLSRAARMLKVTRQALAKSRPGVTASAR